MTWRLSYQVVEILRQILVGFMRPLLLALLVAVVPFSSYGQANPPAGAASKKPRRLATVNPKLYGPSVAQELDGGVWRTDDGFQATLRISNNLQTAALKVTPVLFMADGAEYLLPTIDLKASGSATVNINDTLNKAPRDIAAHLSTFGSASLRFSWSWPSAINASIRNLDAKKSLIFNSALQASMTSDINFRKTRFASTKKAADANQRLLMDMSPRAIALEGLWWKRDPETGGFITLTNRSQEQIPVEISVSSADAKGEFSTHALLAPRQTQRIDLQQAFQQLPQAGQNGAISIRYQGVRGSILVAGSMENTAIGYSAKIPFGYIGSDEHPSSWTLASVGIMHGPPDPMMQFPANTRFQAYAVLRNTSAQSLQVTPTVYFTSGREAKTPETPVQTLAASQLVLSPGEIRNLDLEGLLAAHGFKETGGGITLSLSLNGVPGALLAAIGSVDQGGSYVFEVSPHVVSSSLAKSICFFEVGGGDDTMVSLWNHSEKDEDLLVTFLYNDGHYKLPVHLAAKQSAMFDVLEIIKAQSPDVEGNKVPLSTRHGSITISGPQDETDQIDVSINSATFNVRNATCGEGCEMCYGFTYFGVESGAILNVGDSVPFQAVASYENGAQFPIDASWSSSNWGVASVDWSGMVTGVGPGEAIIFADTTLPGHGIACELDVPSSTCPIIVAMDAGGGAEVKPRIDRVIPSELTAGTPTAVTIIGIGLSPAPEIYAGSSYRATATSVTSNVIVATFTPLASTSGPQPLTVKVNGKTSDQAMFTVLACPTSISKAQSTFVPLVNSSPASYPHFLTGIGIITRMQVSPSINGVSIVESLSPASTTTGPVCPASLVSCVGMLDPFITGTTQQQTAYGVSTPAVSGGFYDFHTRTSDKESVLDTVGMSTCNYSCIQTYSCGGVAIGRFRLDTTFTRDPTSQVVPVTNVTVNKTPVP
jgi:uncharacterized protein YjdB